MAAVPEAARDHVHRVIHIEPLAPRKPAEGAACNGCGVCCLVAPCPVGMLVSRRHSGPCSALAWSPTQSRYHCGMLTEPERHVIWLGRWLKRPMRRWIAAGSGCDSDLAVGPAGPLQPAQPMASRERA
jgi:hypothetical protein